MTGGAHAAVPALLILGASGFGSEVLWVIDDIPVERRGWTVAGFLDDDVDGARVRLRQKGINLPVLGTIRDHTPRDDQRFICAIGGARGRLSASTQLLDRGARFANLVHPSSRVHPSARIGCGTLLSPLTTVGPNARLANFVILNASAAVRADVRIDDGGFVGSRCEVMEGAHLERGAFLGAHVTVHPRVRVGQFATIGIGSVVLRGVKSERTMLGVPARALIL